MLLISWFIYIFGRIAAKGHIIIQWQQEMVSLPFEHLSEERNGWRRASDLRSYVPLQRHFLFRARVNKCCALSANWRGRDSILPGVVDEGSLPSHTMASSFFLALSCLNEGWMFESVRRMNSRVMFVLSAGSRALSQRESFFPRCLLLS